MAMMLAEQQGKTTLSGKIVNRLDEIRQEKERLQGQKITWEAVSNDTGLAYTTVLRWAKKQINRYDEDTLVAFCEYFGVQVGDILVYEPES